MHTYVVVVHAAAETEARRRARATTVHRPSQSQ